MEAIAGFAVAFMDYLTAERGWRCILCGVASEGIRKAVTPENFQAAITQVVSAIAEGRMDHRNGQLCVYALQLAAGNLKRKQTAELRSPTERRSDAEAWH